MLLACIGAAAGELVKVTCDIEDHRTVICDGIEYKSEAHDIPGSGEFYFHLSISITMVVFAGTDKNCSIDIISLCKLACYVGAPRVDC